MMSTLLMSLFIVNFIHSMEGYDLCSSKIYKLSYGWTDNLLVEAHINVIEHRNIFDYHLNITLIGYNVLQGSYRKLDLKFQKDNRFFAFSCSLQLTGITGVTIRDNLSIKPAGKSIYSSNKLICSWSTEEITFDGHNCHPTLNGEPMDLVNDCDFQIYLVSDGVSALVASNAEELPTCAMKYTKCAGDIIYGNNDYSLIIKHSSYRTSFFLKTIIDDPPKVTEVVITISDGTRISIICDHIHNSTRGYISSQIDLNAKPIRLHFKDTEILTAECGWALDRKIFLMKKVYETKQLEGELKIIADGFIVYQENHFKIQNLATRRSTNQAIVILTMLMLVLY